MFLGWRLDRNASTAVHDFSRFFLSKKRMKKHFTKPFLLLWLTYRTYCWNSTTILWDRKRKQRESEFEWRLSMSWFACDRNYAIFGAKNEILLIFASLLEWHWKAQLCARNELIRFRLMTSSACDSGNGEWHWALVSYDGHSAASSHHCRPEVEDFTRSRHRFVLKTRFSRMKCLSPNLRCRNMRLQKTEFEFERQGLSAGWLFFVSFRRWSTT